MGILIFGSLAISLIQLAICGWISMNRPPIQAIRLRRLSACFMLMIAGSGFFLAGLSSAAPNFNLQSNGVRTEGEVVGLEKRGQGEKASFSPIFVFTNSAGKTFECTGAASSNPPQYEVGDIIPVIYLPSEPHKALPDTYYEKWSLLAAFGSVGSALILIGMILLFFVNRTLLRAKHA